MGTYLNRTPSSAGNRGIWTVSCWIKKANPTHRTVLFGTPGSDNNSTMQFILHQDSGVRFGVNNFNVFTTTNTFVMRDPASWYHLVLSINTSEGSSDNRTKFYINGERFTNFDGNNLNNITNGFQYGWNNTIVHTIGAESTPADYMDGYITNFVNIDGQALGPSSFGETDSTTGEWKPKADLSGLTFGTNGFWQKYESAGNLGLDSSGNSNTYTVNNAGTGAQTVDTASNNFCTLNPLQQTTSVTLSNGNLVATNTANDQGAAGTMAFSAGKWYWEVKLVNKVEVGINLDSNILQLSNDSTLSSNDSNLKQTALVTNSAGGPNDFRFNGSTETVNSTACSNGDILMVAVDADNTKIYYGKNGTWMNSGNPAGGSGELKNFSSGYTAGNFITPTFQNGIGTTASCQFNFGNPPFSISSGNADANGFGNFEYAVPSGYYALCTKNINSYG